MTYLALGIFLVAFVLIIFETFDKSLIALAGALLMIITGILTPEDAIGAIEYSAILLLLAMMLMVNVASKSGIFEWLNVKIAALTRGNPLAIFLLFSLVTAICSAFLDNVTTVILIVPLTIELIKGMGRDPKPYIFAEIIFANVGGTLTLIGDPPNILIGSTVGLGFMEFITNLWIPVLSVTIFALVLYITFNWKKLRPISDSLVDLCIANIIIKKIKNEFVKKTVHRDFVIKVALLLFLTIAGFFLEHYIGLPNYIIAFIGATLLAILVSKKIHIHESFSSVEWTTLFFFAGLFIMVAGVEKTGVLEVISHWIANSTTDLLFLSLIVLWISGLISMVLDNIPFVTVMIPVIMGIQSQLVGVDSSILWWALSLGACLGGNGTLVGASCNVVSVDLAKKRGVHITFLEYLKFNLPLTLGFLIVCSVYLFFRLS